MRRGRVGVWILVGVLIVGIAGAAIAMATPRRAATPRRTLDWAAVAAGADASWPHCTPPSGTKHTLPIADSPAFAVVGINDGLPGTRSACIETELAWADRASGGTSAPKLAYYVMAADPWTKPELRWVPHPTWPTSNAAGSVTVAVPAAFGGPCTGGRTERACAYVYGWLTALADASLDGVRDPQQYRFWIDVEAVKTWSADPLFNQAVVEGMAAAFTTPVAGGGVGTTTGVYSTAGEWPRIVGVLRDGSPLDATDQWIAAGRVSRTRAVEVLRRGWPLTPNGRLVMVQYADGAIDRDVVAPIASR